MRSTFMGLEASKRGLFTQQSALYTTGHNISNANTEGYSRQRVNMQATTGYPMAGLNSPTYPGHLGTGVEAGSVQRIRDAFVDQQYRQETNKLGYWESRSHTISQMEDVLTEPSEHGLAESLNEFWNSLQDLNVRPENGGARAVVVQRGIAVADSFHYMYNSIKQIQDNTGAEIGILLKDTNSILKQIADLNAQIQSVEPNGYLPNDLYDKRDLLLDQLSTNFPIEIERGQSGGNALALAEGPIKVSLTLKNGTKVKLVDGKDHVELRNSGNDTASDGVTPTNMVTGLHIVKIDSEGVETSLNNDWSANTQTINNITDFSDLGKLKSLVNSYGYKAADNATVATGLFPEMLGKLNDMASAFAAEFNAIHTSGTDLGGVQEQPFFINKDALPPSDITAAITAANIYVAEEIIANPNLIAASDSQGGAEPGNGKNALALANMKFLEFSEGPLEGVSIQTYFEGLIGQLGVDGQQAIRLQDNAGALQQAVRERRDSVSSVSLDEEMTNMITFQQAYNANARMITVIDEILEKIINGMGRAGL